MAPVIFPVRGMTVACSSLSHTVGVLMSADLKESNPDVTVTATVLDDANPFVALEKALAESLPRCGLTIPELIAIINDYASVSCIVVRFLLPTSIFHLDRNGPRLHTY